MNEDIIINDDIDVTSQESKLKEIETESAIKNAEELKARPQSSTMKDYWISNNPLSIGVYHPELAARFADNKGEAINLEDEVVKKALDSIPFEERVNILENATTKIQLLKQVERTKLQLDARERISKDGFVTNFVLSTLPSLTTPASIATLPIAGFGIAKSAIMTGTKIIAGGATLGAVNMAGDALLNDSYAAETDVLEETAFGAAAGAIFAAPFATFAARGVQKANAAARSFNAAAERDAHFAYDDVEGLKVVQDYDEIKVTRPIDPQDPEYIKAYDDFKQQEDTRKAIYDDELAKVRDEVSPEVESLKKQLDDLEKVKQEEIQKVLNEPDVEVPLTPKEILDREAKVKKETKATIETAKAAEIAPKKSIVDNLKEAIAQVTAERKLFSREADARSMDLEASLKALGRGKTPEVLAQKDKLKADKAAVKAEKAGKLSKLTSKELELVNQFTTAKKELDDILKGIDKEASTAAMEKLKTAPMTKPLVDKKAKVKEIESTFKQQQLAVSKQLKAAEGKHKKYIEAKLKATPKFEKGTFKVPEREFIEKVEKVGGKRLEGLPDDAPRLTKILGEERAAAYQELMTPFLNGLKYIDYLLGSPINYLFKNGDEVTRGIISKLANPTMALVDKMGNKIKAKLTAYDYKTITLAPIHNRLRSEVVKAFKAYKKDAPGASMEDFDELVSARYIKLENDFEKAAYAKAQSMPKEIPFKERLDKAREEVEIPLKNDPIDGAVQAYKNYFKAMGEEGKIIGVKGLKDTFIGGYYMPRKWNVDAINAKSINELKVTLFDMLKNHPGNNDLSYGDLEKLAEDLAKEFKLNSIKKGFSVESYVRPGQMPFDTHLKNRKLQIDTSKAGDLLDNSIGNMAAMYHYKYSGRFAVQKFLGTDNLKDIMEAYVNEAFTRGITLDPKIIQLVQQQIEDIMGTLRLSSQASDETAWRVSRTLQNYNIVRLLGLSGFVQLTEYAGNVATIFSRGLLNSDTFKYTLKGVSDVMKGPDGSVDEEFLRFVIDSSGGTGTFANDLVNRQGDLDAGFGTDKIENISSKGAALMMKYNGTYAVLQMQEHAVAASFFQILKNIADGKTMSKANETYLLRLGLDLNEAKDLGAKLNKIYVPEEGRYKLDELEGIDRDKLSFHTGKALKDTIVEGQSIHNPMFLKTAGPFKKLLFQFLRFPLTAQNILLERGMREDQAALGASLVANFITYMGMQYLMEEAKVNLGLLDPEKRKYDVFNNPEHFQTLAFKAVGYMAATGMFSVGYDYLATVTPLPSLGTKYEEKEDSLVNISGPSIGFIFDTMDLSYKVMNGDELSSYEMNKLKSGVPFMTMPLFKESLEKVTAHYTNE